jgi:hypothetical protein
MQRPYTIGPEGDLRRIDANGDPEEGEAHRQEEERELILLIDLIHNLILSPPAPAPAI